MFYQMSEFFAPDAARGVRYDDPAFGIRWPREVLVVSDRTRATLTGNLRRSAAGDCPGHGRRCRPGHRRPRHVRPHRRAVPHLPQHHRRGVPVDLDTLAGHLDLAVHEVASGTRVFDWTVPREWSITDAYVATSAGERVIDFQASTSTWSASVPVSARMSLSELRPHLHTCPSIPTGSPTVPPTTTTTGASASPSVSSTALPRTNTT